MLPGFPDAALWVVVTLFIVGALLVYFGWMSRGRNRVVAVVIGLVILGYAAQPLAARALDRHPQARDCLKAVWATRSTACLSTL